MSDHLNKCVFILVITFIVILIFLMHMSMNSEHSIIESSVAEQKADPKNLYSSSDFGSSSTIDAIYGNQSEQANSENKTTLKRMIGRQPPYGRRQSKGQSTVINERQISAPISSIPFEFRSFLLRRHNSTRGQRIVRPFNGFKSKAVKQLFESNSKETDDNSLPNRPVLRLLQQISVSTTLSTESPIQPIGDHLFEANNLSHNTNHLNSVKQFQPEQLIDIQVGRSVPALPIKLQHKSYDADDYRQIRFKFKSHQDKYDKKVVVPLLYHQYKDRRQTSDHYYRHISKYPKTKNSFQQNLIIDSTSGHKNIVPDVGREHLVETYERKRPTLIERLVKHDLSANIAQFDALEQNNLYSAPHSQNQSFLTLDLSNGSHHKFRQLPPNIFNFRLIDDNLINKLKLFN